MRSSCCLNLREPLGAAFYESVQAAHRLLQEGIANAGPPMDVVVAGIGHAHLDLAWLWTLSQTRLKAARNLQHGFALDGAISGFLLHPEPTSALPIYC